MHNTGMFKPIWPRKVEGTDACTFYHCMDFADGTNVAGPWDIRGEFDQYVGNINLTGKTVLDIGTASGFLAFSAEKAGAQVVALECRDGAEYNQLHFRGLPFHEDRRSHDTVLDTWLDTLKASFWYGWHRNRSNVQVVYAPIADLPYWDRRFDVVIAGAVLEHMADPVTAIWSFASLAREAVVIAYTPAIPDEGLYMAAANTWDNPEHNYTWWTLTVGLYRRIFANVGFTVEVLPSFARLNGVRLERSTIVARRVGAAMP